jgi:hypothetical protein
MHVAGFAFFQSVPAPGSSYLGVIIVLAMVVLAVVIGFMLAYALFWRRLDQLPRELRRDGESPPPRPMAAGGAPAAAADGTPRPRSQGMICPACRREYEFGVRFCPHDSKQLVPAEPDKQRPASGGICPTCKRAFDPGVKFCPHDAEELISMAFWEATHGKARPSGIIGKICPHCNAKYDLEATFCGKDGAELVAVN